jgi:hypothetical protein
LAKKGRFLGQKIGRKSGKTPISGRFSADSRFYKIGFSLSHPHIGGTISLERFRNVRYLKLRYVGETGDFSFFQSEIPIFWVVFIVNSSGFALEIGFSLFFKSVALPWLKLLQ